VLAKKPLGMEAAELGVAPNDPAHELVRQVYGYDRLNEEREQEG